MLMWRQPPSAVSRCVARPRWIFASDQLLPCLGRTRVGRTSLRLSQTGILLPAASLTLSTGMLGSAGLRRRGGSRLLLSRFLLIKVPDDPRHIRPRLVIRRHAPELLYPLRPC